jgi:uncharacterized alpha-E superfamily protein
VTAHLELDAGEADEREVDFWTPLLGTVQASADRQKAAVLDVRSHLAFGKDNPNSLVACVQNARTAARSVRDSISSEMWEQLNREYLSIVDPSFATRLAENAHDVFKELLEGMLLVLGLADATLPHDEAWEFICLGKYMERADNVARVLNLQAHLLVSAQEADGDDLVRWLAVLRSCGSSEAYSRYYSLRVDPPRVIEFLLLNPVFPQSVRFSLREARASLTEIAGPTDQAAETAQPAIRGLGLLTAQLENTAIDEVLARGLRGYLDDVQDRIGVVARHVAQAYFRGDPSTGRHMALARAAQIMASQQ